jgi:hypothetical protein
MIGEALDNGDIVATNGIGAGLLRAAKLRGARPGPIDSVTALRAYLGMPCDDEARIAKLRAQPFKSHEQLLAEIQCAAEEGQTVDIPPRRR